MPGLKTVKLSEQPDDKAPHTDTSAKRGPPPKGPDSPKPPESRTKFDPPKSPGSLKTHEASKQPSGSPKSSPEPPKSPSSAGSGTRRTQPPSRPLSPAPPSPTWPLPGGGGWGERAWTREVLYCRSHGPPPVTPPWAIRDKYPKRKEWEAQFPQPALDMHCGFHGNPLREYVQREMRRCSRVRPSGKLDEAKAAVTLEEFLTQKEQHKVRSLSNQKERDRKSLALIHKLERENREKSLTQSRSQSPGRDRSQSPGRDRSQSPGRDRSQSPGRDRSQSPGRDRSQSPGRDRSQSPGRDRSPSPGRGRRSPSFRRAVSKLFDQVPHFKTHRQFLRRRSKTEPASPPDYSAVRSRFRDLSPAWGRPASAERREQTVEEGLQPEKKLPAGSGGDDGSEVVRGGAAAQRPIGGETGFVRAVDPQEDETSSVDMRRKKLKKLKFVAKTVPAGTKLRLTKDGPATTTQRSDAHGGLKSSTESVAQPSNTSDRQSITQPGDKERVEVEVRAGPAPQTTLPSPTEPEGSPSRSAQPVSLPAAAVSLPDSPSAYSVRSAYQTRLTPSFNQPYQWISLPRELCPAPSFWEDISDALCFYRPRLGSTPQSAAAYPAVRVSDRDPPGYHDTFVLQTIPV